MVQAGSRSNDRERVKSRSRLMMSGSGPGWMTSMTAMSFNQFGASRATARLGLDTLDPDSLSLSLSYSLHYYLSGWTGIGINYHTSVPATMYRLLVLLLAS